MANWHLVVAYDERAAEWLAEQGYPRPAVRPGNRAPTPADAEEAVRVLGTPPDAPLVVEPAPGGLKARGDLVLELRVLRKVSEQSGQLWVYPDCGSPAIVVDAKTDAERTAAAWRASLNADDPWRLFHDSVYRE